MSENTTIPPTNDTTTMDINTIHRLQLAPIMDELVGATCTQVVSSFAAFILNSAILFVVVKKRLWRQNPSYILLTTIMVADIIVGGSLTSSTLWMLLYDNFLGAAYLRPCFNIECGTETWLYMFGATLDILMSLCIAADRVVSLGWPMWYRHKSGKLNYIFVSISALISATIAFTGLIYSKPFAVSDSHGNFGGFQSDYAGYYSVATAGLSYATISLYAVVLMFTLKSKNGTGGGEAGAAGGNKTVSMRHLKRQKQITNFITTLIVVYAITVSLGFSMMLVAPYVDEEFHFREKIRLYAWGWAVVDLNPFLNGVVLLWKMEELRNRVKEVMMSGFSKVGPAPSASAKPSGGVTSRDSIAKPLTKVEEPQAHDHGNPLASNHLHAVSLNSATTSELISPVMSTYTSRQSSFCMQNASPNLSIMTHA